MSNGESPGSWPADVSAEPEPADPPPAEATAPQAAQPTARPQVAFRRHGAHQIGKPTDRGPAVTPDGESAAMPDREPAAMPDVTWP